MNGLSPETTDALKAKIRAFQDHHGTAELPKCDAAYDRLYPEQIDRFTFRQAWAQVTNERAAAAAGAAAADQVVGTDAGGEQPAADPGTAAGQVEGTEEDAAGSGDPQAAE